MAQQLRESRQWPLRSGVSLMPPGLPGTVQVRIGPGAPSRQSTAMSRRPRHPLRRAGEPDLRGVPA